MLCFRYDSQHSLLVMPFLPWKQSLGCDISNPEELFEFFEHILGSLADVEQMGCIKKQVQSLPYSSEFAQEQLQFPKAFWQKKNAEVSLFLHSPSQ